MDRSAYNWDLVKCNFVCLKCSCVMNLETACFIRDRDEWAELNECNTAWSQKMKCDSLRKNGASISAFWGSNSILLWNQQKTETETKQTKTNVPWNKRSGPVILLGGNVKNFFLWRVKASWPSETSESVCFQHHQDHLSIWQRGSSSTKMVGLLSCTDG